MLQTFPGLTSFKATHETEQRILDLIADVEIAHARHASEAFLKKELRGTPRDEYRRATHALPFIGDVVERGLSMCAVAVALLTPDEACFLWPNLTSARDKDPDRRRWQARPNVLFEAGVAMGLRKKCILATVGADVGLFSDIGGRHIVHLDNSHSARRKLLEQLEGPGVEIRWKSDFLTPSIAGDFEACVPALPDLSKIDPLLKIPEMTPKARRADRSPLLKQPRTISTTTSYSMPSRTGWIWENPHPQGNGINEIGITVEGTPFFAAEHGTLLRWAEDHVERRPFENDGNLTAILALHDDLLWVGVDDGQRARMQKWERGRWTPHDLEQPSQIVSTYGTHEDNLWAVNRDGTLHHWRGIAWHREELPAGIVAMTGVDGAPTLAVGENGTILRRHSGTWSKVQSGTTTHLRCVCAVDRENAWAGGDQGTILRFENGIWTSADNPAIRTNHPILGIWASDPESAWAIGCRREPPYDGFILAWDGMSWTHSTRLASRPSSISGTSRSEYGRRSGRAHDPLEWNDLEQRIERAHRSTQRRLGVERR